MTSCGWLWLYASMFLMLAELAAPGFVIFFFGLSAGTVGLCRFAFGEAFDLTWQIAAFSAFSVFYLLVVRRWMKKTFFGVKGESQVDFDHEYVGRAGRVTEPIAPPLAGRVEIGDAAWTAEADAPIGVGSTVRVLAQNNLTLKVEEIK